MILTVLICANVVVILVLVGRCVWLQEELPELRSTIGEQARMIGALQDHRTHRRMKDVQIRERVSMMRTYAQESMTTTIEDIDNLLSALKHASGPET